MCLLFFYGYEGGDVGCRGEAFNQFIVGDAALSTQGCHHMGDGLERQVFFTDRRSVSNHRIFQVIVFLLVHSSSLERRLLP